MKSIQQLMHDIIQLTTEMETNFPELYNYLDETPLTLGEIKEKEISTQDLAQYLETLKTQLQHHIATHKNIVK